MNRLHKRRKGFTLPEILVGIVLGSIILTAVGSSASKNIKRTNRETVVNEMQVFLTGIQDAYYDLGAPSFDPAVTGDEEKFKRYLQTLQDSYLGMAFDFDTLTATANGQGFEILVAAPLDTYESQYKCWFITKDGVMKYAMVASGGDNCQIDEAGYASQNYEDDIVLVVKPKS